MVDRKYRDVYNQPVKYRVMMCDKWIFAEKYDSIEDALSSAFGLTEDFFVVETFPGLRKFPMYNDNVK